MCATVLVEDVDPTAPRWDRDRVAVVIGQGLNYSQALRQIRALLIWLGAPQTSVGATCWCGDYVAIPGPEACVFQQRTAPSREEVRNAR